MRIGVLTAGGDAPGLNAAIRAIGEMAIRDGHEVIGIANGWAGLAAAYTGTPLGAEELRGVIGQGGTLLGTARYNLDKPEGGRQRVLDAMDAHLDYDGRRRRNSTCDRRDLRWRRGGRPRRFHRRLHRSSRGHQQMPSIFF